MKKYIYFFLLLLSMNGYAQKSDTTGMSQTETSGNKTEKTEMADLFRKEGKIYVVVVVVVIILLGMLFYIFTLEKKISRIEKEMNSKK